MSRTSALAVQSWKSVQAYTAICELPWSLGKQYFMMRDQWLHFFCGQALGYEHRREIGVFASLDVRGARSVDMVKVHPRNARR